MKILSETDLTQDALTELGLLQDSWNSHKDVVARIIEIKKLAKSDPKYMSSVDFLESQDKELGDQLSVSFGSLMTLVTKNAGEMADSNTALSQRAVAIIVAANLFGVVIALFLGVSMSRSLSKPIKKLVDVSNRLAIGDVDVVVSVDSNDELGQLSDSFSKLVDSTQKQAKAAEQIAGGDLAVDVGVRSEQDILGRNLRDLVQKLNEVISNIQTASSAVASGAVQISSSGMVLSEGATEQAGAVEELTATVEDIVAQTSQNAGNAEKANELAETVLFRTTEGRNQMQSMLAAMSEIKSSSQNIHKVVKVIEDIAFQTNILALNAAVEAARAGAAGKGFAVVANEVKNLAQKSADAVKKTTALIEDSIFKVESGSRNSELTAEALNNIESGVKQVAELVGKIAAASNEQTVSLSQISSGIGQVSQVVQTNAATAEESAASSAELSSQAASLQELVGVFRLQQQSQLPGYDSTLMLASDSHF
jgi:methyl-accepting chemotaxis protein